jgi:peptidoglycan/LPS O-acetylase OafA/YrhL
MSKSSLALNNLRGFAILNILAFHSVIAYLGSQPASRPPFDTPPYEWLMNPIIDSARGFGFDLFCAFQYVYLMHMMFFLSGLFVWSSLQRKGVRTFLTDRFLRLGLPFLIGVYLLMPPTYYAVYRVTAVDPSWSAYWSQLKALPFSPAGPMWFLGCLLVFNVVAAAIFWLAPSWGEALSRFSAEADGRPNRYFITLVAVSAVAYVPLAAVFKPWEWLEYGPFAVQPSFALQYLVYFVAGVGIGAYGIDRGLLQPDGLLTRRWPQWLAALCGAFFLWIIPTALIVNGYHVPGLQILADLGFVLSSACGCFALLGIFLRFGAKSSRILDSLGENAYGIYFFHYVFVIWTQFLLLDAPLPAIVKALLVYAVTLLLSWSITVALSRLPVGAHLFKGKQRVLARARQPAE